MVESSVFKTTKQIEEKYGVTRQTLHNWMKEGVLPRPNKDFRNWLTWSAKDEANLSSVIKRKSEENNQPSSKNVIGKFKITNRRYLGSKQKLLNFINEVVQQNTTDVSVVADIFAGTGVVADLFRAKGNKVIVNDILKSNVATYYTWFGIEEVDQKKLKSIIKELNSSSPMEHNYVSKNFGDRYFSMENAKKIGYIREKIETYELNKREKSILITSLLYAMDKVANTVGHYDSFRRKMDSFQPLILKIPEINRNEENEIYCEDANELVKKIKVDLVYIDTPYNSRQYGDAYHLLENIVEWKQLEVEGSAKKMVDRSALKSKYSTRKAPMVFDDLIQNINAKYILVSYNNMAKKGNGRSNAKISNEEILKSLEKRGVVEVFETPFKVFTAGKTDIENHKELLYLCTVKNKKSEKKGKYVQSPINYSGGKYKLLSQILPLFPSNINTFFDVFAGGANVGINVESNQLILNDIEKHVMDLYRYIKIFDIDKMIDDVHRIIKEYGLSDTRNLGYEFYKVNSSEGLKIVNEKQYLKLRDDYNFGTISKDKNLIFYVLLVYAFNNQIRFNSYGYYNMPPGKRDFNEKMENKLRSFKAAISKKNINFTDYDFRELLRKIENKQDFVYLDPPYLISRASYNENGGWTEQDEKDLLDELDNLNQKGIKFALSNVLLHKGRENLILKSWAKKYHIHFLNYNYNNSNYQSAASRHQTIEVLITNY